jgi:hypothetical protein
MGAVLVAKFPDGRKLFRSAMASPQALQKNAAREGSCRTKECEDGGPFPECCASRAATHSTVILRSRALARRLEGWPQLLVADPSRLAEDGEHLRMTEVLVWPSAKLVADA